MAHTIYTLKQYEREVERLLGSHENEISVYALGLAGEAGELIDLLKKHWGHKHELDVEKLKKEAGDVFWYIAALAHQFEISLDSVSPRLLGPRPPRQGPIQSYALRLANCVGNTARVLDAYWTSHFPPHDIQRPLRQRLQQVFIVLERITEHYGLSLSEVLTANVEKLRKRYPDGFSTEASVNRVDVSASSAEPAPKKERWGVFRGNDLIHGFITELNTREAAKACPCASIEGTRVAMIERIEGKNHLHDASRNWREVREPRFEALVDPLGPSLGLSIGAIPLGVLLGAF